MESQSPKGRSLSMINASSKNTKEKKSPLLDPSGSSEQMNDELNQESNLETNSSNPIMVISSSSMPLETPHSTVVEQEREYGCKYCDKKFSNKQALGGHQNAHKLERTLERNPREIPGNHFGYFGGLPSYPGVMAMPAPSSFNSSFRSHDLTNRGVINRPYVFHQGMQPGHFPRPVMPMATDSYVHRPLPGLNHVYHGWTAPPPPRVPSFVPSPINPQFIYMGPLPNSRPISEGLTNFNGSRSFVPVRNNGGRNNNQVNGPENQRGEDSGLDLSLKL